MGIVPYLIFYSDDGPDFITHCNYECSRLEELKDFEQVKQIENARKKRKDINNLIYSISTE